MPMFFQKKISNSDYVTEFEPGPKKARLLPEPMWMLNMPITILDTSL